MAHNREKGAYGERLAAEKLESDGYRILARNFRCKHGEIDLIAEKYGAIVFIEVKYRRSLSCGYPAEAVTPAKQRKIRAAADFYIYTINPNAKDFRFDVFQIIDNGKPIIEHIENAF